MNRIISSIIFLTFLTFIFMTGCTPNPGSKTCQVDTDCKPLGSCERGCWNQNDLPSKDKSGELCGALPPFECSCINQICTETINGQPEY